MHSTVMTAFVFAAAAGVPQYRTQTYDDYAMAPPPTCTNSLTTPCLLKQNYASCLAEAATIGAPTGLTIGVLVCHLLCT
jgi:hypothetical protein